jgi:hypothetical protein
VCQPVPVVPVRKHADESTALAVTGGRVLNFKLPGSTQLSLLVNSFYFQDCRSTGQGSKLSLANQITEGFALDLISPVFRFAGIATLLKQLAHQGGPTGLMAGSEALPGVAVKILVEKDEIAPV